MPTAAKPAQKEELDPQKRSSTSRHFEEELRQRVVGQSGAVQALVDLYDVFCAGLHSATRPFLFRITNEGREFLLEEGTDQRYGARHLKRAIERNLVRALSRLPATGQLHRGDVLLIDRHRGEEGLVFLRDTERRSSGAKIDFPVPNSRQLMTAEVRV